MHSRPRPDAWLLGSSFSKLLSALFRFRGVLEGALFLAYLVFIDPRVSARFLVDVTPDWPVFIVLVALQLIELVGFILTRPLTAYVESSRTVQETKLLVAYLFPAMFHIMLAFMLGMLTVDRINEGHTSLTPGIGILSALVYTLVLVKEAFFVSMLLPASMTTRQAPRSKLDALLRTWLLPKCPSGITPGLMLRDLLGGLCLLVFSMLAYSLIWGSLAASSPIDTGGGETGLAYVGLSLFFFMFYFGSRAVHLMREIFFEPSQTSRILTVFSLLANYVVVLLTFPRA
jgi:hypothetical protein